MIKRRVNSLVVCKITYKCHGSTKVGAVMKLPISPSRSNVSLISPVSDYVLLVFTVCSSLSASHSQNVAVVIVCCYECHSIAYSLFGFFFFWLVFTVHMYASCLHFFGCLFVLHIMNNLHLHPSPTNPWKQIPSKQQDYQGI